MNTTLTKKLITLTISLNLTTLWAYADIMLTFPSTSSTFVNGGSTSTENTINGNFFLLSHFVEQTFTLPDCEIYGIKLNLLIDNNVLTSDPIGFDFYFGANKIDEFVFDSGINTGLKEIVDITFAQPMLFSAGDITARLNVIDGVATGQGSISLGESSLQLIEAIPEPGTLVLFCCAIPLLVLSGKRLGKKSATRSAI